MLDSKTAATAVRHAKNRIP